MKKEWRKYLTHYAPRYTSYPSALAFSADVDASEYRQALENIELYDPLSIYVHVPFCKQACWYCGCNMRVENRYERAAPYVDALLAEISLVGNVLESRGQPASIHFGGGTPNFLTTGDLARILERIESEMGLTDDARLGIELDPRLCEEGQIERLAQLGFSRMSMGVQDFELRVQEAINRVQCFETVARCTHEMRAAGVEDVSFDLLYGLPLQTPASFSDTIFKTIDLSPDRISLFGYAHLPQKIKRQRLIDDDSLPDANARADLVDLADRLLVEAGYARVGFDHYAKPENSLARAAKAGTLRRNFQGFTDDPVSAVIGFGASAISFVNGVYAQNATALNDYLSPIQHGDLATVRGYTRTFEDEKYGRIIADLMCFAVTDLRERLGGSVLAGKEMRRIKHELAAMVGDGVVDISGDIITISGEARGLSRLVAAAVDPGAKAQAGGFSRVM